MVRIPSPVTRLCASLTSALQPPKANQSEIDLSLRFKYGIHTIYMLVSPLETFTQISADLLEVLNERYPDGLSSTVGANDTPIPADAVVSFGILQQQSRRGGDSARAAEWRHLNIGDADTPVTKGLKDGMDVAFVLQSPEEAEDGAPRFVVEWPSLDDEEER
ncbi:hypothetical protein MAPG_04950 [Magnaporthiopsis poae ATCC 64411]|uniref:Uncharacterized protein n=1 Tax=Magnaporthiopsis poae (strain ATCC 64411 / 73-15) TaxID=644358 RepID=A0A0C4DY41_MAGP6|nr:hypothetical protein MAPG_04950 [Magnaporthiopsis poae ATCC 64411]